MTQPWVMWFQQLYAITGPQVDDVIPSVLLSLDMTASGNGDFVAKWLDPTYGNNTLYEIAEEYSTSKASEVAWVAARIGGCLRWGYTNTLRGSSPNTSYYFRFAARNQSSKASDPNGPGGAGMSLAGELGWGPWVYSGNTTTMGSATLISSGQVTITLGTAPGGTGLTIDSTGIKGYAAGVLITHLATSSGYLQIKTIAGWSGTTDLEIDNNLSFIHLEPDTGLIHMGSSVDIQASLQVWNQTSMGGLTDYSAFSSSGVLTLHGAARVNKNLTFALDAVGRGATAPAETRLGNTVGWAFTINDDGYFSTELPYDWDSTTGIEIKLHYYTNEAYATNSGEVRWEVAWAAVAEDVDEVVDAPTHSGTLTGADKNISATAKGLQEYNVGTIAAASLAFEDCLFLKLKRIALTAGNNPTAEPVILAIEMEYTANTLGEAT